MTYTEIVTAVQSRLNLTSTDSATRIGTEINDRYRRVTSALGLNVTRRTTITATATIGDCQITFAGEKLMNVEYRAVTPWRTLKEYSVEEMRDFQPYTAALPFSYAIVSQGAATTIIEMDCTPDTAFTLYADAYAPLATISGSTVPAFPADYHDILVHGVLADEYRKMSKLDFARDAEQMYEMRLSQLRVFLATSAYRDTVWGQRNRRRITRLRENYV